MSAPEIRTALWGEETWFANAEPDGFPLLVKRIDARLRLSVQVHPDAAAAAKLGGRPKTEMWCVLEPGTIYAGFKPGVGRDAVERAIAHGTVESLLARFDAKPGECYFIPAGLVHAIGDGVSVFEVQQPSETTYRIYDWGRVGADFKPRTLHVREALESIDFSLPPPEPVESIECRWFGFRKLNDAAEIAASDLWRAVYEPESRRFALVAPGETANTAGPALVATAYAP